MVIRSQSRGYERPTHPSTSSLSDTYKLHIGFKRVSRILVPRTKQKLSTKSLGEGWGGRFRPCWLVTYSFSRLRCKSTAASLAVGLSIGAGVARRRAEAEDSSMMIPDNSDDTEIVEQLVSLLSLPGRFDAVDTADSQVSNGKSQDGEGGLTRLTDLTVLERGVYVTPALAPALAGAHPLASLATPSTTAVKSVKSVKPHDGRGGFSTPRRQTGCQFDGIAAKGVVA